PGALVVRHLRAHRDERAALAPHVQHARALDVAGLEVAGEVETWGDRPVGRDAQDHARRHAAEPAEGRHALHRRAGASTITPSSLARALAAFTARVNVSRSQYSSVRRTASPAG